MIYYPFFPADYAVDTAQLSDIEDLMYRRLLDAYYTQEQPLSSDNHRLYRSVRAFTLKQRCAVDFIINSFFVLTDDGYCNSKADKLVKQYRDTSLQRRNAGLISAQKRKQQREEATHAPTHVATHAPTLVPSSDATEPPTKRQQPKTKNQKTN